MHLTLISNWSDWRFRCAHTETQASNEHIISAIHFVHMAEVNMSEDKWAIFILRHRVVVKWRAYKWTMLFVGLHRRQLYNVIPACFESANYECAEPVEAMYGDDRLEAMRDKSVAEICRYAILRPVDTVSFTLLAAATPIIPRSHSYCLSLPSYLECTCNGSITPRVHSGVSNRIQCRLQYRPSATVE